MSEETDAALIRKIDALRTQLTEAHAQNKAMLKVVEAANKLSDLAESLCQVRGMDWGFADIHVQLTNLRIAKAAYNSGKDER